MSTVQTTEPAAAYARVGHYPSNTYVGASQAYGTLYQRVDLPAGETVWMLPGGDFIARDGVAYPVKWALSDKHLFEKVYLHRPDPKPPTVEVDPLPLPPRRDPVTVPAQTVYATGTPVGRSIDYLVEGAL